LNGRIVPWICAVLLGLFALPALALVHADRTPGLSQDELDQLVAPVALYPDPLLAHVLAAATYPAEVGEAVRFSGGHQGLRGQELAMRIRDRDWEPNVSALIQFPVVLAMMGDRPDWVKQLGDAVLEQEAAVLETVQTLRGLALREGSLRSSPEQRVYEEGDRVLVLPARPRDICVPVYDAARVYGVWWVPGKPPMSWKPAKRSGPRVHDMLSAGVSFAPCATVAAVPFVAASPDWAGRSLNVTLRGRTGRWAHDPPHRRGVPYRTAAVRARFESAEPDAGGLQRMLRASRPAAPGPKIIRPPQPAPAEAGDVRPER